MKNNHVAELASTSSQEQIFSSKEPLLKISIVMPVYNMARYVEATLRSIVTQNYPDLELIVIDGGSTDGTIAIVEQFSDHITHFVSERDNGQYAAINKGFALACGDIVAWLNADDLYYPWTFRSINEVFGTHPTVKWVIGKASYVNGDTDLREVNVRNGAKPRGLIAAGWFNDDLLGYLQQESMFWRRELLCDAGFLNERYSLAADFDLWTRFARYAELNVVDFPLASFRRRAGSRSVILGASYKSEVKMVISELDGTISSRCLRAVATRLLGRALRYILFGFTTFFTKDNLNDLTKGYGIRGVRNHGWSRGLSAYFLGRKNAVGDREIIDDL